MGLQILWFSAMYLALMLVLVALIVRGVSFEFRNKIDTHRWKHSWTVILTVASAVLPILFGIAMSDLLVGLPIDSDHEYTGTFWNLLTPYGIWVGITLLSLTLLHGTTVLNLRTTGIVDERARRLARLRAFMSALATAGCAIRGHERCCEVGDGRAGGRQPATAGQVQRGLRRTTTEPGPTASAQPAASGGAPSAAPGS